MSNRDGQSLHYLGKRRPTSLEDQSEYKEPDRLKVEEKAHKNPKGIDGTRLSNPKRKGRG